MEAIHTHNITKLELEVEEARLLLLLNEKEELYSKHFTRKGSNELIGVLSQSDPYKNKMLNYTHDLTKPQDKYSGQSLEDVIKEQANKVGCKRYYLMKMETALSTFEDASDDSIIYELYYLIVVKGLSKNKAINNVAARREISSRGIYKNHYKKLLKELDKLKKSKIGTLEVQ